MIIKLLDGKEIEVLFENEHEGHTTNYIEVYSAQTQEPNTINLIKVQGQKDGKIEA